MNMLIVDPASAAILETLNSTGDPLRQLRPATLLDGRLALNADLLLDCLTGQTWEHYRSALQMLPIENVTP